MSEIKRLNPFFVPDCRHVCLHFNVDVCGGWPTLGSSFKRPFEELQFLLLCNGFTFQPVCCFFTIISFLKINFNDSFKVQHLLSLCDTRLHNIIVDVVSYATKIKTKYSCKRIKKKCSTTFLQKEILYLIHWTNCNMFIRVSVYELLNVWTMIKLISEWRQNFF